MGLKEQLEQVGNQVKEVVIDDWGFPVYVKVLGGLELWAFSKSNEGKDEPNKNLAARMATYFLCDEKGELLYPPGDEQAAELLGRKNRLHIERIVKEAMEFNGLTTKAVEDAKKN